MFTFSAIAQDARLIFIGLLLFVIPYQLWVAYRRRTEPILCVVAGWATAALVMMVGRAVQHATDNADTVILGSRIFHSGVLALVPLGFRFMHDIRGVPLGRVSRAVILATAVPVALVWTGDLVVSGGVRPFETLAGPVLGPAPAPLGPLGIPYIVAIAAYLLYVARRGRRDLPWHQRLPLAAAMLLLVTLVNDALLFSNVLVTIELAGVGLFVHVIAINIVIFARAGQLFASLEQAVDVQTTELRVRERDLSRMVSKLQVSDRLATVGTLAAGVAHEINNPLAFIVGNLEWMKGTMADASRLGPVVDECLSSAWRIAQIVKDLRVFARADDDSSILQVQAILAGTVKMARVTMRRNIEITTNFGPAPLVRASAGRLSQVFLNLLINAGQAIPDDGAEQAIHVSTSTDPDGRARVEIADSGPGIDPAIRPNVFDPFVTTKPVGTGTGLGLFICHGIVTSLGGEIRLVPREPSGTIAQVLLPPAEPAPADSRGAEGTGGARRFEPASVRVLVVDDEDLALRVLSRQLQEYAVTTVTTGAAAIERLSAEPYDVVLCDLVMPGRTGMDVWKHAQALGLDDRFILITGGATTDAFRDFIELVRVACLTKPIAFAALDAAIQEAAARGRARRPPPP